MNRTFHARITVAQYLFLALLAVLTFYALWNRMPLPAAVGMLLLVGCIERLIHTTYTFTPDGRLLLYYGRFARSRTIDLAVVNGVRRASAMRIGRFCLMRYLVLRYAGHKYVSLLPDNEDDFIRELLRRVPPGKP